MTLTRLSVSTAFVAMLRAQLTQQVYFADTSDIGGTESGLPPADAPLPYVVIYGVGGGKLSGPPLTAPESIGEFYFQTTSVGGTASQADWMDDKVGDLVVGRTVTGAFTTPLTVVGATILDRYTLDGTSGAEATGSLFQSLSRYCITVT